MCLTTLQVVRDEYVREAQFLLEFEQQVEGLRLHGDVEGGHGLVGYHQARVQSKRAGDADPLPLAAAEGMREPTHVLGAEANQAQQLLHPVNTVIAIVHPLSSSGSPIMSSTFILGFSDERGVLEHHLHLGSERT